MCAFTHIHTCNHVCMQSTRYPSGGGPARPARGGSQTAVISEKRPKLGFLMTGLVTQGVIFQTRKGRPIVLLIRVLWTDSRTWICRPIYGGYVDRYMRIYGVYLGGGTYRGGYLVCNIHTCVYTPCTHMCTTHPPHTYKYPCICVITCSNVCTYKYMYLHLSFVRPRNMSKFTRNNEHN